MKDEDPHGRGQAGKEVGRACSQKASGEGGGKHQEREVAVVCDKDDHSGHRVC